MEGLDVQSHIKDRVMTEEQEDSEQNGEQDEGETEASSPVVSSTEEETDEDSEPEPPPVIRRKVSFADAFGLNLVSVKEFDNAEATEPEPSWSNGRNIVKAAEEIYLSCLFTVPSSTEELDQRLGEQMVELESIELLPGTTTLRGIVRVVNLCYNKTVFARLTLDRWSSYFDLLADYVPGSSDRKTDRFTFRYTVVPPFEKEGTRVEFCLRYETPMGTFWANNKGMNYVMFCHQKAQVKEGVTQTEEETSSYKSKRSCLKANRNGDTEKPKESIHTNIAAPDGEWTREVKKTFVETSLYHEDQKPWVESVKRRRRAIRLARVQDYLCQRAQQQPKGFSHDSDCGLKVSQHVSAARGDSASCLYKSQKMQSSESPQVLTYHQIPLPTLDWNSHTPEQPGTADGNDILTGRDKVTLSKESEENTPSVNDMWESFSKSTHDSNTTETSVTDEWQVFLNGPSCKHHSDVPESEWLQTAGSVLPSNHKEPRIQYSEESQEFEEATDTPTTLQTLAACQLLSDTCETLLAAAALNSKDDQLAEACVSSTGDDNTATRDLSQRSQTNSATDTPQEFNLKRALPLSEGTADSPTERHRHKDGEQKSKDIIGTAGRGEGKILALHTADSVTSSGELETTDMTVMPETPNASNVDTISPDARQDGGLSWSGEREVTGNAHNAVDDILAFRETIREETRDRARYDFSASGQGEEEEEIMMNYTAKKVPTEEEIFRPLESKECNTPLRYGDKIQYEEFRQSQNGEMVENETEKATKHTDEFESKQRYEGNLEKNRNILMEASEAGLSNYCKMDVVQNEVGDAETQNKEMEEVTDKDSELMQMFDVVKLQQKDRQSSLLIKEHDAQSRSVQVDESLHIETTEDLPVTEEEQNSDQTSEAVQEELSCDRKAMEQKEVSPSADVSPTVDALEAIVCQTIHDTQISCHAYRYDLNHLEVVEPRLTDPQTDSKTQKRNSGRDANPEVMAKENCAQKDTLAELRPETSRGTKQDLSEEDERVCVGRLKIEAARELIGNAESPRGENENAWKEQESPAKVKTSPHVEYNKMAEGIKDPITGGNSAALDATQPGIEQMFVERFGDNLVCSIWEEVFARELQTSAWHANTADDLRSRATDATEDHRKNLSDTCDSGAFSPTEFPADPACQGPEPILITECNEHSLKDRIHLLTMTERTDSPSELQTDWDSIANLNPIVHNEDPLFKPAQYLGSPKDRENSSQIKARSVSHQTNDFEIEGCKFADTESANQSSHLSNKHQSSSEKFKESDAFFWWTILYTIIHITRLLICMLLVGGFFVMVFLYDFPAFFALYIFSMSWWIFKWKRHQVMTGKTATE
ncbi:PREDICTED: protein phosphatase 1 regulatory subunit 3A isoform X1 [Poecilia mexicana]|nr:PREDICTED: protein phosphatase 1 regulatory subunit 3A isoform X1 [Poecilia mexicana]